MQLTEAGFELTGTRQPPDEDQVKTCIEWLDKHAQTTKNVNSAITSYGWKHFVEQHMEQYVSNGAFIKACIDRGLSIKKIEGTPNVFVNISNRSKKKDYVPVDKHVGCHNWPNCDMYGCGFN